MGDVVRIAQIVVLLKLAVGEYQCAIFMGGKDVFRGIIDGMRQQVDIVTSLLDVGNVLYISFQCDIAVFATFAGKCFQADVEDLFV